MRSVEPYKEPPTTRIETDADQILNHAGLALQSRAAMSTLLACLTQLAEYRFCKPNVIGSTPIAGFRCAIGELIGGESSPLVNKFQKPDHKKSCLSAFNEDTEVYELQAAPLGDRFLEHLWALTGSKQAVPEHPSKHPQGNSLG